MLRPNRWLLGSVAAALCLGLLVLERVNLQQDNQDVLLQKPDHLEARLHRDLKANGALPTMLSQVKKSVSKRSPRQPVKSSSNNEVMQEAFVEMGKDNKMLRHEVEDLQQQSLIMAQVLKAYTKNSAASAATHKPKARLNLPTKAQRLALIDTPLATKWWTANHPGGATLKSVKGLQENPIDLINSEDPTLDPFDPARHYLRAPMPHDPASSLVKTVTGDYGSPMTYKDIVNNKRTIDWCVLNFDFVTDREKCIAKINKGPLLM